MASYTADEVDAMSIEEIEQLAEMMTAEQLERWCGWGYCGESYVRIMDGLDD